MSIGQNDSDFAAALGAAMAPATDPAAAPLVVNYPVEIGPESAQKSFQRLLQQGLVDPDDMIRYVNNGALFVPVGREGEQ